MICLVTGTMQRFLNHPVYIIDHDGKLSPSAFIPFCTFGANMSAINEIFSSDDRVCNCFQGKILNDQLCYEVDLEKFKSKDNLEKDLKSGLSFVMDYNEDRQVDFNNDIVEESNEKKNAIIYLNTIGSINLFAICESKELFLF